MGLGTELLIRMTAIVAITDLLEFWLIMKDPSKLTWTLVILIIIVTLIPIVVNLWWVVTKYGLGW